MTEDTRKDPRTKFVSLNVRFKSANVEEFIDNHSYDVSRGGLFVKTSSPFASGTLLKFEIRLAADEPVIAGVGRVVWKRETSQATPDRPAGMGVKFIKVDDKSRDLIERVVAQHGSAGGAYDVGEPAAEGAVDAPKGAPPIDAPAAAEAHPASAPPGAATSINRTVPSGGSLPASMPPMPMFNTTVPQSPAAKAAERAPEARAGGFFPETDSVGDMPAPEERTVMRQASEFLEVALKEAGGSLEELGKLEPAKPISAPAATIAEVPAHEAKSDAAHEAAPAAPAAAEQAADGQQAPAAAEAAAVAAPIPTPAKSGSSALAALFDDIPALDGAEAKSAPAVADAPAAAPAPPAAAPEPAKPAAAAPAAAAAPEPAKPPSPKPVAAAAPEPAKPPSPKPAAAAPAPSTEKKSGGATWVVAAVLVAAGLFGAYKLNVFGGAPSDPAPVAPETVKAAAPTASAPPVVTAAVTATATATASAPAAPSASAPAVDAAPSVSAAPAPTTAPTIIPPTPEPAAKPVPSPVVTKPAPAATTAPTTAPTPKPKPAPKPAAEDDNPY